MITVLKSIFVVLINFVYITIFKYKKTEKMPCDKAPIMARTELKKLSEKLLMTAKVDLKVVYLDRLSYQKMKLADGIVIISNHVSNFDIPVIMAGLDIPVGFVAKKEMEKWPFYSRWMKLSKSVFLDRNNPREGIKGIKRAADIAKEGFPMVIFPEGSRSKTGDIGVFKKGSFKLATDVNGIILPLTINGTQNIQSNGKLWIKSDQKVTLVVGKPIYVSKINAENKRNLPEEVRELISAQRKEIN